MASVIQPQRIGSRCLDPSAGIRRLIGEASLVATGALLALASGWLLAPLGPGGIELLVCLAGTGSVLYAGTATCGARAAAVSLPALLLTFGLALAAVDGPLPLLAAAFATHGLASLLLGAWAANDGGLHRLLTIWGAAGTTLALLVV